ncbi:hypothetical protein FRB90_011987 [Tulasnella sp. 427]|nr:hypothetical protein FRB90_011987 [Tulasnella sp. 427]
MPKARQQTLEEALKLSSRTKNLTSSSPSKDSKKPTQYQAPRRSRRDVRSPTPDSEDAASDTDTDVRQIPFESTPSLDDASDDGEASEEEAPVVRASTQRTPRRPTQRRAPPTPPSSGSESPLSDNAIDDDDDDEPLLASGSKSRKRRLVDSDDEPPRRRKLVRGKGRPSSEEDEEDLMEEIEPELILETRLRGTLKQSKFSANLDRMKRRRKGERPPSPEQEVVEISDSDSEAEAGPSYQSRPFKGARPPGEDLSDVEDADAELDGDFIEHDSDNDVAVELPVAFSRHSHQDLSLSFKAICQLYVHLAIQPQEDRTEFMEEAKTDDYFQNALRALNKTLDGLRDSLVRSSVWKPEFTDVLNTYPEFEVTSLDYAVPTCDACHMGGRVSTFMGRASGRPYRKDTFEPKADVGSDSDESDDDSDAGSDDSELEKDDYKVFEFNLGRFCAARAKAYFRFIHWQYLLYSSLKSEVDLLRGEYEKKGKKKGKAFFRKSWGGKVKLPDDKDDGDQVMKWLDDRGIIQNEWKQIKKLMENAHQLEASRNANDDDLGLL